VLTLDRLDELVPVEPAAMENRQVIEWDKDDIDALKFMKVDVLGLGMLGCTGVPLFQEQAMQVAMVAAGFSPTGSRPAPPRDGDVQIYGRRQRIPGQADHRHAG
jgi:DNA polymerase III alpha subunit